MFIYKIIINLKKLVLNFFNLFEIQQHVIFRGKQLIIFYVIKTRINIEIEEFRASRVRL